MRDDDFPTGLYIVATAAIYLRMSRSDDTRAAIVDQFRLLKAMPDRPIGLFEIAIPLSAAGFMVAEIVDALFQLHDDKEIELIAGNQLPITHDIGDCQAKGRTLEATVGRFPFLSKVLNGKEKFDRL